MVGPAGGCVMTHPDLRDQNEFVTSLVFTARGWLDPMPVGCERQDPLTERLSGLVFSLFPQLDGAGDMPQMRLSPKGHPEKNLVGCGLHDQWPDTDADDPDVATFLKKVADVLSRFREAAVLADTDAGDVVMGQMTAELCQVIEEGYELRPQWFDDDDRFTGEGDDVAVGLAKAFAAAWDAWAVWAMEGGSR